MTDPRHDPHSDSVETFLRFDHRLDDLTERIGRIERGIDARSKPFWKRGTVIGSGVGILIVATGWLASLWMDEPEIPRIVHSNVLLSDRALALTLQRGRSDADRVSPLNTEIHEQVKSHLQTNDVTKQFLYDIAAKHGTLTYSGSRTYLKHRVPIGSVACLMLSEPEMRELLRVSSDAAPGAVQAMSNACTKPPDNAEQPGGGNGLTIAFTDFSPLVIPFRANGGDQVELIVRVLAHRQEPGIGFVADENGHRLVQATLYPDTAIDLGDPPESNVLRTTFQVQPGRDRHSVAVFLNDAGEARVDSDKNPEVTADQEFVVSLFVTLTVTPQAKL